MHIIIALASLLVITTAQRVISLFDLQTDINTFDVRNSQVYVASINHLSLLNFSTEFKKVSNVVTGPKLDSELCNYDGISCVRNAKLTQKNYISRIIHATKKGILECGSLRQGVCQKRHPVTLEVISNGSIPVVPNDNSSSCVSLIDENDVLYVASTSTSESPYRESMPAVCSREPPDYNTINAGSIEGEAAVHIRYEYRRTFKVNYITGFFHQHYVYFLSRQNKYLTQKSQPSIDVTKIIRICKNDSRYVSYSEISIQCIGDDNRSFNRLTSATLVGDRLIAGFSDNSLSKSAICMYPMSKIKLTFWYNIDRCHAGGETVGLPHIGRNTKCVNRSHLSLSEDTCSMGVGGVIESNEISNFEIKAVIQSMASTIIDDMTVVIAGTQHGSVLQLHIRGSEIEKYNEQILSNKPVSQVRFVDEDSYIAASGSKLFKMTISDCDSRASCKQCVDLGGPFCGWCLLEGRCTLRSKCSTIITNTCPSTNAPVPSNISVIAASAKIFVPFGNYPIRDGTPFICGYDMDTRRGWWSKSGVLCDVPKKHAKIIAGDHSLITMQIFYAKNSLSINNRTLVIYNCSAHTMCTSCTKTQWGCHWCSSDNICLPGNIQCEGSNEPSDCPHIGKLHDELILISDMQAEPVSFGVSHLQKVGKHFGKLFCKISANGKDYTLLANHTDDRIRCETRELNFGLKNAIEDGQLSLLLEDKIVDSTNVSVYKCSAMASDCSSCLALDPKWGCSWCHKKCNHFSTCDDVTSNQSADVICGQPIIYAIEPETGPVDGGTYLVIKGKDLGLSLDEVANGVLIGKSKCKVVEYDVSSRILCVVERGEEGSFPVQLQVGKTGRRYAKSNVLYKFVKPFVTHIFPKFGPQSGGTKVTVHGVNLTIGSNVTVTFGQVPCNVIEKGNKQTEIVCLTGPSNGVTSAGPIHVRIDNYAQTLPTAFEYRLDPVINSIYPTATFKSGGRLIAVQGEHLDSVLQPRIFISPTNDSRDGSISELGDCGVQNSTSMFCRTPKVDIPSGFPSATYSRWPIGFLMDNVESVRNLGYGHLQMTVVPDPLFAPFNGILKHRPGDLFVVEGGHLSYAAFANEYQIFIGSSHCIVTELEKDRILCKGPEVQPRATDEKGNAIEGGLPIFVVIIGTLRFELGLVEYETFSLRVAAKPVLVLLCALCIFCLIIGFLLYFIYKRRKLEYEGNYRRIHVKVDDLENDVRCECKQAYTELQVEMADLSSFVDSQGLPFFDKTDFASKILFHEISTFGTTLSKPNGYCCESPESTAQFDTLLWNKHFIITVVQMIETDYSKSVQDRSLFASLLTASLIRNMAFFTDVVITLLTYHVEKCIKNRNAQLLFRQNGSVIEKMFSYWFLFCLYDDLRTSLGRRFYLLEEALKYQIMKGPADAVTGSARYTLNEHNLLREAVEATPVQFLILPLDQSDQSPVIVRALSCDTVTQLKSKLLEVIFRYQPYSTRLSGNQFDLIWRSPDRGTVVLCDEDRTELKGFRKLKFLADYGLPNNALLSMQIRSTNSLSNSSSSEKSCASASPQSCKSYNCYHLELPSFSTMSTNKVQDSNGNLATEKSLSQLLMSKGTLQKFINDFYKSVLLIESDEVPFVVKYTFDLLEKTARQNNVVDSKLVRSWKANAWTLRFWLPLISNLNCLFDCEQNIAVNCSLLSIGASLNDLFNSSHTKITKDCTYTDLMFAKDIERQRSNVKAFFRKIKAAKTVTSSELSEKVTATSKRLADCINSVAVNSELLSWITNTGVKLVDALYEDSLAREYCLGQRLSQVLNVPYRENEHIYATLQ